MNNVWRSDWKLVTPVAEFGECQLTPIEGSPESCPMYSTVYAPGPWLLEATCTKVPGAGDFGASCLEQPGAWRVHRGIHGARFGRTLYWGQLALTKLSDRRD